MSAVFRSSPFDPVELDPVQAQIKRQARDERLNVVEIPRLRLIGFTFVALAILMHDRLVLSRLTWAQWLEVLALLEAYCLVAWLALWAFYRKAKPLDLALVFLGADLVMLDFAIYVTGGDRSWIFFILCARVSDQSHASFRRALLFAHLAPVAYVLLLAYLVAVDHQAIAPATEAAKVAAIYGMSLYMALTGTSAEQRRNRMGGAIRVARELISRLTEQSAQLEEARRRAETASEAKSQFLATMSHELRTPLNAIIGFSQVMAKGTYGTLSPQQSVFVESILKSGRHLLALVNDILDLAKVEAGRMELQRSRFDAAPIVEDVVAMIASLARDKSLEVVVDIPARPLTMDADAPKFRQIVLNLLTNAVKFTPEAGRVKVSAVVVQAGDHDVSPGAVLRVSVADTGIGIEPEDQVRIFESFVQVDSSYARVQQGTGLGLALTRRLVELHGGRLSVESEGVNGKGSVFTVELPVAPTAR